MKPEAICYDAAAYFLRKYKRKESPDMLAILEQELAEDIQRLCEEFCIEDDDDE